MAHYPTQLRTIIGIGFALFAGHTFANEPAPTSALVESREFRNDQPYDATQSTRNTLSDSIVAAANESVQMSQAQREERFSNSIKSASSLQVASSTDYWIFDSWITLDRDIDYDGYFSTFSVEFDADTVYADAPVYAVIYLGTNGYFESIHVTSEFILYGDDSTDSFLIESDLIRGFPPRDYDVLIELYDAYNEQLVASSDNLTDADLSLLPLESNNFEVVPQDTVVIVEENGGSTTLFTLLALILGVVAKRKFI